MNSCSTPSRPVCQWCGSPLRDCGPYDSEWQAVMGRCPKCEGPVWSLPFELPKPEPENPS